MTDTGAAGTGAANAGALAEALAFAGIAGQRAALRAGTVTSAELVEAALGRIAASDGFLGAFRTVLADRARQEASERDSAAATGTDLPLLGVPLAVKENGPVAGAAARFGTGSAEPVAATDGAVPATLTAAGAVIIGTTTMPELALWPFTESAAWGMARSPLAPARTAGGSSGGSAAAVAAGLVAAATGTDGGGSIRVPAACCGLVGLKPTHGLVPLGADRDHWHGLSHAGYLTRTVADTALLLSVATGAPVPLADPGQLRIALSTRPPTPARVDPVLRAAVLHTGELLRELGHRVEEADPPYGELSSAFLPRYLSGARADLVRLVDPGATERRTRGVGRLGAAVPARLVDAARRRGAAATVRLAGFFTRYDLLITPTLGLLPLPLGRLAGRGSAATLLTAGRMVTFTVPWNVTGQPAAAVPAGSTADGVPLSVQLVGRRHEDALVLSVAAALERVRDWPAMRPPSAEPAVPAG